MKVKLTLKASLSWAHKIMEQRVQESLESSYHFELGIDKRCVMPSLRKRNKG